MRRRLKAFLMSAATLLLATTTMWFWLLHTTSGSHFIWSFAEQHLPGTLSAEAIDGDLSGGLHLRNVQFSNDNIQVSVAESSIAVNVSLIPLSVEFETLDIQSVDVHLLRNRDEEDAQDTDIAALLLAARMPITILAPEFRLTDLKVALPGQELQTLVSSLRMNWQLYDKLQADRIELATPLVDVLSDLILELQPPFAIELHADASIKQADVEGLSGIIFAVKANGDAERININLSSIAPELSVTGTIASIFGKPLVELHARSPQLSWPVQSDEPEIAVKNLDIHALGSIEQYELTAAAEIALPGLGELAINVAGTGSLEYFRFDEVLARGNRLEASASGRLDWRNTPGLVADIVAQQFDPRGFIESWPRTHPLRGDISLSWHENDIDISRLKVFVAGTPVDLSGSGQIDIDANIVNGALIWKDFQWPLDAKVPAFASETGEITIKGKVSAWSVEGTVMLQANALPESKLRIEGNGDRDGIALTIRDSNILGGTILGRGDYRWRDNHPFNASLHIDQVQTALLSSDWPGILSGGIGVDGTAQPFAIDIDIARLQGEIREKPFLVSGALSFTPDKIGFRNFDLMHGDSMVALDGTLQAEDGVDYRFNVAKAGDYSDTISGSLSGSGKVSLSELSPRLRGSLSATNLTIGEVSIESLQVDDKSAGDVEFVNHGIEVHGLRIKSQTIETISIIAKGSADHHELQIDLLSEDVAASIEASGELTNWQQLATIGWQGELENLQVRLPDDLTIALHSPAPLMVSANEAQLGEACVDIHNSKALCLRTHWIKATSIDFDAEMQGVPLSAIMLLVDTDLDFSQELSGRLSWSSSDSASTNASVAVEISPGRIVSTYDTRIALDTGTGTIDFQVDDGKLGSGTFDLPFPEYGTIDIDLRVGEMGLGADSPLSGSALIDMSNINTLVELFPFIDSDGGRLATDLAFSGTLSNPSIEGSITLRDANLKYLPLGTALSDLQIDVNILDNNRLHLEGRFRAGEGTGTVVTTAAYEAGSIPDLEFEIVGSNLLLIDDPDGRVIGDPDINISIHDRSLQLDGKIRIAEANLTPSVVPGVPVSESDDVTIVAGDARDNGRTTGDDQDFRINGTLEVELGNEVNVDLGVAAAAIEGKVVFEWHDEFMPNATGSLSVNGTISAFGQVLQVAEGAINFPNIPASEPHLRIKAEREIYGNSQVRTAGILLTGTAKRPVVEAYTYPLTTEERALTLLATGSDFDYEQGVGALDFGTYIAPRVYLSYGIGLFETGNVISARYDLTKGFGIRVSSGERESGVDLSYRLDK